MEAAGLAVGIVSLYHACFDCYSFFTDAKKAETESSSQILQLEIQQALLKSWGFHWQIPVREGADGVRPDAARQEPTKLKEYLSKNRYKSEAVFKTLSALLDTLSDQKKLGERYGIRLKPTQSTEQNAPPANNVELSAPGTTDAQVEPVVAEAKARISVLTRVKWALKDKASFKNLIADLKTHADTLYRLCPEHAVPSMNIFFVMECVAKKDTLAGLNSTSMLAAEHAILEGDSSMRDAFQLLASTAALKASVNKNKGMEKTDMSRDLATIEEDQPQMLYLGKGLALYEEQVVYVEMRDYRGPPIEPTPEQKEQMKEYARRQRDRKIQRLRERKELREVLGYDSDDSSIGIDDGDDNESTVEDAELFRAVREPDPKLRALVQNFFNTFRGDNMMRNVEGLDITAMIDHTKGEEIGHCSILYKLPGTAGCQSRERPAENLKLRAPVTLKSLLNTIRPGIDSTLGARFRLARRLVRAVCLLHSSGWLHKNIRAESVLFFPTEKSGAGAVNDHRLEQKTEIDVSNPVLMGYIFSRPDNIAPAKKPVCREIEIVTGGDGGIGAEGSTSTTWELSRGEPFVKSRQRKNNRITHMKSIVGFPQAEKAGLATTHSDTMVSGFTLDYYQHPAKHANPRRLYRHAYDVYSLGVLLLEVGLWKNLRDYEASKEGDEDHYERRRWICGHYLDRLRWECGDKYANVVLSCLMIDSSDDEMAKASERELCARIVAELEHCQA